MTRTESEFLSQINQGVPADLQDRYDELISKRRAGTLTGPEQTELVRLAEQVETIDVERIEFLAELAQSRQTSLPKLMADLRIKPPPYV